MVFIYCVYTCQFIYVKNARFELVCIYIVDIKRRIWDFQGISSVFIVDFYPLICNKEINK